MKQTKFLFACLAGIFNPAGLFQLGAGEYSTLSGATKTSLVADGADEEIGWAPEIIASAANLSFMGDNMTGRPGSGKPIISFGATKTIAGSSIVISTRGHYGAPGVQGTGTRPGQAEAMRVGDFRLRTSLWWAAGGIDQLGLSQTIHGKTWYENNKEELAGQLARKQSNDALFCLKHASYSTSTPRLNVVFPAGRTTVDGILSSDTYSYSFLVRSSGKLRDIGAKAMNVGRNNDASAPASEKSPVIPRYMQLTSDANARPILTDPNYSEAIKFSASRGTENPWFTGIYQDVNGMVPYFPNVLNHGDYGPIGAAIQPEALLGVAVGATSTLTTIQGGGSATAAAITPYPNYFEAFSRLTYTPINGITSSFTPRATYGYIGVVNADTGKISYFRYTTNTAAVGSSTANTLSGLTRLAAATAVNEATTIGDMTWGVGAMQTAADGDGFQGLDAGVIPVGSKIYEVNSKGVPLGFGYGLGEMALVCGYGQVPINGGREFRSMAVRTSETSPHGNRFEEGIQVAWGCDAFERPDGNMPNFVLNIFARQIDGFPNVTA